MNPKSTFLCPPGEHPQSWIDRALPGDVIQLPGGTWHLDRPIRIHGKTDLVLEGVGDRLPIVRGGIALTEWRDLGSGRFEHHTPRATRNLVDTHRWCRAARWPKEGYARSTRGIKESGLGKRALVFDPASLPPLPAGERVHAHLWPSGPMGEYNWHTVDLPARVEGNRLILDRDTWFELGVGTRFFLYGHPSLLDAPGEFAFTPQGTTLRYLPPTGDIRGRDILLPLLRRVIDIRNSAGITLRRLHVEGTDRVAVIDGEIFDQVDGAIHIEDSGAVSIESCEISHTGLHGVSLHGRARRCAVETSHLHDIGHTGIRAYGEWVSDEEMNGGHWIHGNHIHHVGAWVGHGAGIQIMQSADNTLSRNRIHHSPRYAVSLLGPNLSTYIGEPRFNRRDLPPHLSRDYSFVRGNSVVENDCSACNLDSQDTGVIQAYCAGDGNRVLRNIVRDSDIPFSFGTGIYLDDHCTGFTVEDNLLLRLNQHGAGKLQSAITLKGIDNTARGNRIVDCRVSGDGGVVDSFSMGTLLNYGLRVERNLFSFRSGALYSHSDWQTGRYRTVNRNVYWREDGNYRIRGAAGFEGDIPLSKWRAMGYDPDSITAAPGFVDPERDDFRLRHDSPAHRLGVAEIPYHLIGLPEEYTLEAPDQPARLQVLTLDSATGETDVHAFVSLRTGESRPLRFAARARNGVCIPGPVPELTIEGDAAALEEQILVAKAPGYARLAARLGDAHATLDILVDDEVTHLELLRLPPRLAAGDRIPAEGVHRTRLGRWLPARALQVKGAHVADGWIHFPSPGIRELRISSEALSTVLRVEVRAESPRLLIPTVPALALTGEDIPVAARAVLSSGRTDDAPNLQVTAAGGEIHSGTLNFQQAGTYDIVLRCGEVEETRSLRVAEPSVSPSPPGMEFVSLGEARGRLLGRGGNLFDLYATGRNVWFGSDDAMYAAWIVGREAASMEVEVLEVERIHPHTQCGLMVRASSRPDSRCATLRVSPDGGLMFALREEDGAAMRCVAGIPPHAEKGGNAGKEANPLAAGTCPDGFPVRLRMTFQESTVLAETHTGTGWVAVGECPLDLPPFHTMGVVLFSGDPNRCARAGIRLPPPSHLLHPHHHEIHSFFHLQHLGPARRTRRLDPPR